MVTGSLKYKIHTVIINPYHTPSPKGATRDERGTEWDEWRPKERPDVAAVRDRRDEGVRDAVTRERHEERDTPWARKRRKERMNEWRVSLLARFPARSDEGAEGPVKWATSRLTSLTRLGTGGSLSLTAAPPHIPPLSVGCRPPGRAPPDPTVRRRFNGREGACLSGPFATLHSRSFHAPSHILLLSLHPRPSGSVPEEDVTVGSWRREERDTTEGRGRSFTPLRVSFIPVPTLGSYHLSLTSPSLPTLISFSSLPYATLRRYERRMRV